MFFIRPGAARAVKTVRLVGTQQRGGRLKGIHLGAHGDGRGLQRAPPACRTVIGVNTGNRASFIGHLFTPAALFWLSRAEKGVRQPRRRSVNRMASPEKNAVSQG